MKEWRIPGVKYLQLGRPIPERFQGVTLEGARDPVAFKAVMDADLYGDKGGLILHGHSGSGKTAGGYWKQADGRWDFHSCAWGMGHVSASELFRINCELHSSRTKWSLLVACLAGKIDTDYAEEATVETEFFEDHPELDNDTFRRWACPYGLLIDDIHDQHLTPEFASALKEIIDGRMEGNSELIITSELNGPELLARWIDGINRRDPAERDALVEKARAIVRRINDYCIPIRFRWEHPIHSIGQ